MKIFFENFLIFLSFFFSVFECKNRLSEHFCSAFKSMCLFPTGDSAITSVALIHTLHYLRHFIGGGNMRVNN